MWKSPKASNAIHFVKGWRIVNRKISDVFPHVKTGRAWFLYTPAGEYEGHYPTVTDAKAQLGG